jgi:hypothetical protein
VNIALAIFMVICAVLHKNRRALDAARNSIGIPGTVLRPIGNKARAHIHASLMEIEYQHVPRPHTVFAGPIFEPDAPVSSMSSPDLAVFLNVSKTVLINLGTLFKYTEKDVSIFVDAISTARIALQDRGGFRVLWKLPQRDKFSHILDAKLGNIRQDIRVVEWIEQPSLAVLQHPNLVAFVHHGGASEAVLRT